MAAARQRFDKLLTEQPNPAFRHLDRKTPRALLKIINAQDRRVPNAVAQALPQIEKAAGRIVASLSEGGRLFFVGAGTSGRLGVLEAAECPPTFGTPPSKVQAIMAGGRGAVFRSREGAEDDAADGARKLGRRARKGDVVVGIAASGVTPFVRGALGAAKKLGCATVLVTSNRSPGIREAQIVIAPVVGPEVLAGSTRMKAATAAKLVLNSLTLTAMVGLNKVYDRWMVDLRPSSAKLEARALRIIADLGGVAPAAARRLFTLSGRHVKTAVLMARSGLTRAQAARTLGRFGGALRAALEETT